MSDVGLNQLSERLGELKETFKRVHSAMGIGNLQQKKQDLEAKSEASDFWDDQENAQEVMQRLGTVRDTLEKVEETKRGLSDAEEFLALEDASFQAEVEMLLNELASKVETLELQQLFQGSYDGNNAILTIHAGTGGVDAQDWAQLLSRMYLRYADQKEWKITVINENPGEEAGLKRIDAEVKGVNAYGHLKAEHGVHRLVRLSPFNSKNSRETSFALVEVIPEMAGGAKVEIDPKDMRIDVFRSSGNGGQSVNTTDSAVRITHLPTGIVVSCQNERSQLQNKQTALKILQSRLQLLEEQKQRAKLDAAKGEHQQGSWGNQIRSYVMQPYTMVKDHRTNEETSNVQAVLDGNLEAFIRSYLLKNG